ncbi:MAG: hypothetical protein H6854_04815 [Rhodospirillales bacterium]|nr:hypothetical protein [Rhodospirillales bacterium]
MGGLADNFSNYWAQAVSYMSDWNETGEGQPTKPITGENITQSSGKACETLAGMRLEILRNQIHQKHSTYARAAFLTGVYGGLLPMTVTGGTSVPIGVAAGVAGALAAKLRGHYVAAQYGVEEQKASIFENLGGEHPDNNQRCQMAVDLLLAGADEANQISIKDAIQRNVSPAPELGVKCSMIADIGDRADRRYNLLSLFGDVTGLHVPGEIVRTTVRMAALDKKFGDERSSFPKYDGQCNAALGVLVGPDADERVTAGWPLRSNSH